MVEAAPFTVNLAPVSRSTIATWLRHRSAGLPAWADPSLRLLPPRCLFCGQRADLGRVDLCSDCLDVLPWREVPGDRGDARALQSKDDESETNDGQGMLIEPVSMVIPFDYAAPVDAALRDLKFHGDLAPARLFGALLAAVAVARGPVPDLVVPIPLHADRLHERGFNQAAHLARALARWLGCACAPQLLERRRATAPQTTLDGPARRRNVQAAFGPAGDAARQLARLGKTVRHLALVDDVLTTGATMAAAAEALEGAGRVSRWAVAQPSSTSFTPARGPP